MDLTLLLFRLILAGVLGVAGAAKFADLAGSRKALADFDVPGSFAGPLSVVLPAVEIAAAILLLFTAASWYGAIAGTALLAAFCAGMARQMVKGKSPDCHCFGQLHSEPVSYKSMVRNVVFLIPAVLLVAAGPSRQGTSLADMNIAAVQLFAVFVGIALLATAVFFLRRISEQQTQIMRRIELLELISKEGEHVERHEAGHPQDGLPIGALVPQFELDDIRGGTLDRATLVAAGKPSIFFFVSPTCSPCKALAPKFDEWEADLAERVNFVFVSTGTAEENAGKFGSGAGRTILLQKERELADIFQARWTPTAVFADKSGRIASHPATGDAAIIELIERIRVSDVAGEYVHFTGNAAGRPTSSATVGADLPEFSIDSVDGDKVSSTAIKGTQTLLTFWSPGCPHCVKMIDEIKQWDLSRSAADPHLVLFSSGEPDELRELGLLSPVVADADFKLSEKLGMFGTPSALLVDENGKFASEIAVGAPNIWALIGRN